jgi:hypothetical protein
MTYYCDRGNHEAMGERICVYNSLFGISESKGPFGRSKIVVEDNIKIAKK